MFVDWNGVRLFVPLLIDDRVQVFEGYVRGGKNATTIAYRLATHKLLLSPDSEGFTYQTRNKSWIEPSIITLGKPHRLTDWSRLGFEYIDR